MIANLGNPISPDFMARVTIVFMAIQRDITSGGSISSKSWGRDSVQYLFYCLYQYSVGISGSFIVEVLSHI